MPTLVDILKHVRNINISLFLFSTINFMTKKTNQMLWGTHSETFQKNKKVSLPYSIQNFDITEWKYENEFVPEDLKNISAETSNEYH